MLSLLKARNDAIRKSWMTQTADLNMERDGNKLWCLTKQVNDEGSRYCKIVLIQDGTLIHGKKYQTYLLILTKQASNI